MRLSSLLLLVAFRILLPPALIGSLYVYLYPAVWGCGFPTVPGPFSHDEGVTAEAIRPGSPSGSQLPAVAPFRLLALADPQLEGDTSVPYTGDRDVSFAGLRNLWERDGWDAVRSTLGKKFKRWHKLLDLWGNDRYLAHVYRTMQWWSQPTHVVVLGDLLGSQWIDDGEFERRRERFWGTVFRNGERWGGDGEEDEEWVLDGGQRWDKRIMAVAGNHDIGYAGDIDRARVERWERAFGKVNWATTFSLPSTATKPIAGDGLEFLSAASSSPSLRLVNLNSMNLDSPAYSPDLQSKSWEFLHTHLASNSTSPSTTATILLTHIPLHKSSSHCVDQEHTTYFPPSQGGGIREQNFLFQSTSHEILSGLARSSPGGAIILNGHDHAGCHTLHILRNASDERTERLESTWSAAPYATRASAAGEVRVREITVRSMMGDFGGNAGLLSAWWDDTIKEWRFEYSSCAIGVQHIWWAVHVLDLVVVLVGMAAGMVWMMEGRVGGKRGKEKVP